jgi:hypothetical protein
LNNLKALVEKELGDSINDSELEKAEQYARRKLDWIISREGDAQGERLKPWYLAKLISETVYQNRFSEACMIHNALMNIKIDCAAR